MGDAVATVCAQMRSKGVIIPKDNEWLNACIECFMSINPRHSPTELFDFVFEQWTLADLKDVAAGTLPSGCCNCTKMILKGQYAVQFNYFLNVAVPFHKQLQKIRRPDAQKNLEVDNEQQEKDTFRDNNYKGNSRSLKIEITDGVTTVVGFETTPIPMIKNKIPGEKAILKGPIEVRKGVLMLHHNNVTLLGGEVDTLLVTNAEENILARALKQPENPDPYKVENRIAVTMDPDQMEQTRHPSTQPSPAAQFQSIPTSNNIPKEMLDDGVDDAILASLAEAMEEESFLTLESPPTRVIPPGGNQVVSKVLSNANHFTNTRQVTSNVISSRLPTAPVAPKKRPNSTSASKALPSKQQSITSFLSQPKKVDSSIKSRNCEQVYDLSSEMDDFDDDFELIAAQTASMVEQSAMSKKGDSNVSYDPHRLKMELEKSYNTAENNIPSVSNIVPKLASRGPPDSSKPESDSLVQKKRKDPIELDVFGRPKIPRGEECHNSSSSATSSSTAEASVFRNPIHDAVSARDSLGNQAGEETFDWLPPPQKANLDHVRPSHEKGKILIDYTDASTFDLDSVPSQKSDRSSVTSVHTSSGSSNNAIRSGEPFPPREYPCSRTVLGKVTKVINKLQLRNAQWILSAIVEVKGIEMEMVFTPQVLDKIFTVTAEEIVKKNSS